MPIQTRQKFDNITEWYQQVNINKLSVEHWKYGAKLARNNEGELVGEWLSDYVSTEEPYGYLDLTL